MPEQGSEENEEIIDATNERDWENKDARDEQDPTEMDDLPQQEINDQIDMGDEPSSDQNKLDKIALDTMPIPETGQMNDVSDEFIGKTTDASATDKYENLDPSKSQKQAKIKKVKRRQAKGRPKKGKGTQKHDFEVEPKKDGPPKRPYRLRNRPRNESSSEDEEDVKAEKRVSFKDAEPQAEKIVKIQHGEPLAEIEDMI